MAGIAYGIGRDVDVMLKARARRVTRLFCLVWLACDKSLALGKFFSPSSTPRSVLR
jgi:hypothetical protein